MRLCGFFVYIVVSGFTIFANADSEKLRLGKIIGGETASIDAFPWMVKILRFKEGQENPDVTCGGTIIGSRWILTAAACVGSTYEEYNDKKIIPEPSLFYVGWGSDSIDYDKSKTTVAVNYDYPVDHQFVKFQANDIAIIELTSQIRLVKNGKPRAISFSDTDKETFVDPNKDNNCVVIGFGIGSDTSLKQCKITEFHQDEYKDGNTYTGVLWVDAESTCHAHILDQGSPVMCKKNTEYQLIGHVTTIDTKPSESEVRPDVRSFFVSLVKPWRDWIAQVQGRAFTAYINKEKVSHSDAEAACKDKGGVLAKPTTWREYKEITDIIKRTWGFSSSSRSFWIGLKRDASCMVQKMLDQSISTKVKGNSEGQETSDCKDQHDFVCQFVTPVPKRPLYSELTCCGHWLNIKCGQRDIEVVRATLGREYVNVCKDNRVVTSELPKDFKTYTEVNQTCNGKHSCSFQLPDVKCQDQAQYLNMTYKCTDKESAITMVTTTNADNPQSPGPGEPSRGATTGLLTPGIDDSTTSDMEYPTSTSGGEKRQASSMLFIITFAIFQLVY